MEKEVFDLEQENLTTTYNKLLEMKKDIEEQIAALDEKASDENSHTVGHQMLSQGFGTWENRPHCPSRRCCLSQCGVIRAVPFR